MPFALALQIVSVQCCVSSREITTTSYPQQWLICASKECTFHWCI